MDEYSEAYIDHSEPLTFHFLINCFMKALNVLKRTRIHRVFLVDDAMQPKSVLSLSDFLELFWFCLEPQE